ncbi:hypothetical protein [Paenibacillus segetis]|uniref:Uncharacterized protein n=1 Tax=Paenibacillus segetis TaxID=1325360 RepID=A0ABQ1Y506_9BACL|nr:hypothetical protein [Paenibacillus segetis]GGH12556.1 hypothetical protein GCM10008013_05050 [Paenibacillus segetis]
MVDDYKTPADYEYERYVLLKGYRPENDIPDADLLPHDTRVTQGISEEDESSTATYEDHSSIEGLQDVPSADDIMENTPVDPAAPDSDIMHGIDLLNGYNGEDTE